MWYMLVFLWEGFFRGVSFIVYRYCIKVKFFIVELCDKGLGLVDFICIIVCDWGFGY